MEGKLNFNSDEKFIVMTATTRDCEPSRNDKYASHRRGRYVNGFVPASQKRSPPVPNLNRRVGISTSTQSCAPGSTNSFNAFSKTSSGMPIAYFTVSFSIYSFPLPGSWYRLHSQWKIFAFASSTVIDSDPISFCVLVSV